MPTVAEPTVILLRKLAERCTSIMKVHQCSNRSVIKVMKHTEKRYEK